MKRNKRASVNKQNWRENVQSDKVIGSESADQGLYASVRIASDLVRSARIVAIHVRLRSVRINKQWVCCDNYGVRMIVSKTAPHFVHIKMISALVNIIGNNDC